MYQEFFCKKGCCKYKIAPYTEIVYDNEWVEPIQQYKKAGCFIHDPKTHKILLVQSHGALWGPPKGSMEPNENTKKCSIREVKEECGLDIEEKELTTEIVIKKETMYYVIEREEEDLIPQIDNIHNNDANGIGYFNVDCLQDLVDTNKVKLNLHCKLLIKKVLNKDYFINHGRIT
jgi:ADP-ribose pyrophosphatase YjhB (NUDIX family)